ncbi:(2,3-dihydroxybenzoyl)adenylate synthase [Isoptericola sp. 178]|uniref:(2,3-dihydroxybenzoyl)adenylate synthase n=1 Tax=Isoptericola sp. 178 TaxID=3064651 RepID=UPI002713FCB0|nr:AMP-binding protein [Isoptericola sp. 178]MDO8145894.1 AMP-binding protein [Isoptericola sp. 178]
MPVDRPAHDAPAWPPRFAAAYRRDGVWDDATLFELLVDAATRHATREALVDGGRTWTHAELVVEVEALAAGLRTRLDAGDRVVVQLPNCAEAVLTTLACFAAGTVPVWTLPQHREHELAALAGHCGARALVTSGTYRDYDHEALGHRVRDRLGHLEHVVVVGEPRDPRSVRFTDLPRGAGGSSPLVRRGPASADEIAVLIPSGGTTGASKVVPHTHNDLGHMLRAAGAACRFDHTSRYLVVLPVGHGFANTGPGILGTLVAGGTVVVSPSPAPETALRLAVRHRATATSVVPAVLARWVEHLEAHPDEAPSFVLVQSGAAYLAPGLAAAAERLTGCVVQQVYGMSEGMTCVTRVDDPLEVRRHTQGTPISPADELRVVDDDGVEVPDGHVGTLSARGPYTIRGYYRSPEADRRAFTPDGWYVTGDLVVRRPDGRVVVKGRTGDTINRGGEKVSADEVEQILREHGDVDECAVVAMPHDAYGEEVCAFVVCGSRAVGHDEVVEHLRAAGLAEFKLPKQVFPLHALPLTGIGKIDRRRLRAVAARAQDAARPSPVAPSGTEPCRAPAAALASVTVAPHEGPTGNEGRP